MRVVAGKANQASIAFPPTTAGFQSIGLEPNIENPFRTSQCHIPCRSMTRSAKLDRIDGSKCCRIENRPQCGLIFGPHTFFRDMLRSRSVAGFARDPGNQMAGIKLALCRGRGGVAPETALSFPDVKKPA